MSSERTKVVTINARVPLEEAVFDAGPDVVAVLCAPKDGQRRAALFKNGRWVELQGWAQLSSAKRGTVLFVVRATLERAGFPKGAEGAPERDVVPSAPKVRPTPPKPTGREVFRTAGRMQMRRSRVKIVDVEGSDEH